MLEFAVNFTPLMNVELMTNNRLVSHGCCQTRLHTMLCVAVAARDAGLDTQDAVDTGLLRRTGAMSPSINATAIQSLTADTKDGGSVQTTPRLKFINSLFMSIVVILMIVLHITTGLSFPSISISDISVSVILVYSSSPKNINIARPYCLICSI